MTNWNAAHSLPAPPDPEQTTDSAELRERWGEAGKDTLVEQELPLRLGYVAAARNAQLHLRDVLFAAEAAFKSEVQGVEPLRATPRGAGDAAGLARQARGPV